MSVVAEELGFIGVVSVIVLVLMLVSRALVIGRRCLLINHRYGGYLAYGIGVWFSLQAFVNIGVASSFADEGPDVTTDQLRWDQPWWCHHWQ